MRKILEGSSFHSDFVRQEKRGKDFSKLDAIVTVLAKTGRLAANKRPHKLHGVWAGFWECHIESNWLLIYEVTDKEVLLVRTGAHEDLFE